MIRRKPMKRLVFVGALLLAACAGQNQDWTKPNASAAEVERDSQDCQRRARIAAEREAYRGVPAAPPQVRVERGSLGAPDIVRNEAPGGGLEEAALRNQLHNRCMQDLGYSLVKG